MQSARRSALITGGSKGIGRGIAERLARDGIDIAFSFHADDSAAADTVRAIEALGAKAIALKGDMGDVSDVRRVFAEAEEAFGRLDIFVANAGFFIFKPIAEMSEAEYDAIFALNTKGVFFGLQEAAKRLQASGRVVLISASSTSGAGAPNNSCTGAKAAAEFFIRSFARELADKNITANIVCPGPTRTENFERLPPVVRERAATLSPFGRIADVADIADIVGFLVSDEARWISGQALRATGGG